MLDAAFNADFGLARLVDHGRGAHTTELAGTMGYMDPDCMSTGRFSTESDNTQHPLGPGPPTNYYTT
jgi:interleukin-1 receptor-associated kinase 1